MDTQQPAQNQRLPLLAPQALNREQHDLYCTISENMLPWAQESGFKAVQEDGRLLGPFNALLYDQELGTQFLKYLAAERSATELDATVREVVILTVGAARECAYELYAHRAVAAKAGLAPADIDALATGVTPPSLDKQQLTAHQFTKALVVDRHVPDELFSEAKDTFGHKGLVDLVHLVGLYLTTSALLNAFDVPVPDAA